MKNEVIQRYIQGDTLIIVSSVRDICEEIAEKQNLTLNGDYISLGYAAAFTAALSAEQKEAGTYITACFKWVKTKKMMAVTAFGDGRVCAYSDTFEPPSGVEGVILEVTRHSDVGGDYHSVVLGRNIQGAVNAYITESMQRNAKWKVIRDGRMSVGVFAEELPGSNDLRKVWDSVKPFCRALDEEELIKGGCEKLGESELTFGCHCSKRSAQRILETLPKEERASLGPTAEVVCKFCGRKYEVENE